MSFLVEGEFRGLPSRTSSLLCSVASSVGTSHTSLEFASFGSGPDAKYNIASACCFFLSTTMVSGPNTFSQEKHPRVYLDRAAIDKQPCILSLEKR